MLIKSRFIYQLILTLGFGLNACTAFGPSFTPTPAPPTATPAPPTATPPPSVAVINGEYLTAVEFQAELARYKTAQTALGVTVSEEDANILNESSTMA